MFCAKHSLLVQPGDMPDLDLPNRTMPQRSSIGVTAVKAMIIGLVSSVVCLMPTTVWAGTVLDRIAKTGKLVAGTRIDAAPFAYLDGTGQWVGYSIDLLGRIQAQLGQELRRPIQLELVEVNNTNRMEMVMQGDVDIVCGSTSYTRSRAMDVDFSISYFITGTQLLIKPSNPLGRDFTIGALAGTTNQQIMQQHFPIAQFVQFPTRAAGLSALDRERIDALASDGILLEALRRSTADPEAYQVVPDHPYDQQQYACILPQGNADFQAVVDAGILGFMQGVLESNLEDLQVLETWFGPDGVVPINLEPLMAFFHDQVDQQRTLLNPEQPDPDLIQNSP